MAANAQDLASFERSTKVQSRKQDHLKQRLKLTEAKILSVAKGARSLAEREDLLGKIDLQRELSDGLVLDKVYSPIGVLLIIALLAAFSAKNMELDKAVSETGQAISSMFGFGESRVLNGVGNFVGKAFPIQISTIQETNRIENFDPNNLPMF